MTSGSRVLAGIVLLGWSVHAHAADRHAFARIDVVSPIAFAMYQAALAE